MTGTQWETVAPIANRINMPAVAANATKVGYDAVPLCAGIMRRTGSDGNTAPRNHARSSRTNS